MRPLGNPSRRHALVFGVAALSALGLALSAGCSRNQALQPLQTVSTHDGAVVAGQVLLQDERGGEGVVVKLEPVTQGMTATVREAIAAARRDAPTEATPAKAGAAALGARAANAEAVGVRATVTDAAGRYAFDAVPPGDYVVSASSRNYLAGTQSLRITSTLSDTTYVDIQLTPTGTFTGVTTLENATNHASTVVYVNGTSNVAVTDAAGNWVMRLVPIGTKTLTGTHAGWLDRSTNGTLSFAGDSVAVANVILPLNRNIVPVATAYSTGTCSLSPLALTGTGADVDGTIVLYEWDYTDDGVTDYVSPTTGSTTHLYAPGTYRARFTVRDNNGGIGVAVVNINAAAPDSVFVSASTGSPAGTGTKASPFQTIAAGISTAVGLTGGCPPTVVISNDTYNEILNFPDGIRVIGGFSPATWTRSAGNYSIVTGGTATAMNLGGALTVSGLDIRSPNASGFGNSSIALVVNTCPGTLVFDDCRFAAGTGSVGLAGPAGTNGTAGSAGGSGQNGASGSSSGGNGGSGGAPGTPGGTSGAAGGLGGYNGNGAAGSASAGCVSGTAGSPGSVSTGCSILAGVGGPGGGGCAGTPGTGGPAGIPNGTFDTGLNLWQPNPGGGGGSGTAGKGAGGGGGGGGGITNGILCNADRAGGGGGGGGGGGLGSGGGSGGGGGASIAVVVYASNPTFSACGFKSANGGVGGVGGTGGSGGAGGAFGVRGLGADDSGAGGNGGTGGSGGSGGGGGGGSGGPSYGIYELLASPVITSPTFLVGFGGSGGGGGPGGTGAATGSMGVSGSSQSIKIGP